MFHKKLSLWLYLEEGDEVGLWGGLQLSLQPSSELLRLDLCILNTHTHTHTLNLQSEMP